MIKFRLYFDKDKEELWLNEMSQTGYAMTRFFMGFYTFEPCEPGEYIYQIDLFTEEKRHMSKREYINLIQECGAEYICRWGWWRFFRRRAELGDFELYTDEQSRLEQLSRVYRFFRITFIFEIAIFLLVLITSMINFMNRNATAALRAYASGINMGCLVIMAAIVAGLGIVCYRIRKKINQLKCQLL